MFTPSPDNQQTSGPSFLRANWERIAAFAAVGALAFNLFAGYIHRSDQSDATVLALSGVSTRLDRVFERLDVFAQKLPVIEERLAQTKVQVEEGKGAYASLETRFRAIENNLNALHEDAVRSKR